MEIVCTVPFELQTIFNQIVLLNIPSPVTSVSSETNTAGGFLMGAQWNRMVVECDPPSPDPEQGSPSV